MTEDQLRDKKAAIQAVFNRTADTYAGVRHFPIYGEWLVETAAIPDGASVLDVASGRGAVLFPAAARVGSRGRVIGTDISEGMVRATAAEIRRRGLGQAEIRQMDAEQLDFRDDSFDFVLCGFAVQFFPHLARVLAGFRRVVQPAGVVAVTSWGEDDPAWGWFQDLRESIGAVVKLGSQQLDTPDKINQWFSEAGFREIRIHRREVDMVHRDEQEWWNVEWSLSGRAGLEKLEPSALEKLKEQAFAKMQPQKRPEGFHERLTAFCTTAKKE